LYWVRGGLACEGELACEWELQPIIARNPPRSWGSNTWRARPVFRCPIETCQAGAYHLFLAAREFACRRCAGVEYPSREDRDPDSALHRRLAKLRAAVGVREPFVDPPSPSGGPRSKWLFRRKVAALRLVELQTMGAFEALIDRGERRLARAKGGKPN
jgi:hypothetical protein